MAARHAYAMSRDGCRPVGSEKCGLVSFLRGAGLRCPRQLWSSNPEAQLAGRWTVSMETPSRRLRMRAWPRVIASAELGRLKPRIGHTRFLAQRRL